MRSWFVAAFICIWNAQRTFDLRKYEDEKSATLLNDDLSNYRNSLIKAETEIVMNIATIISTL